MYHIYLVDDDAVILDELRSCVSWLDNGFDVVGSSNFPLHALEEIVQLSPDLVISDLKMEPIDGIQLMQTLKARGVTPHFLMMSGYATFENSRRFFLEGGFDYLLKPVDPQELQLVLDRLYQTLSAKRPEQLPRQTPSAVRKDGNPALHELMEYLQENYVQKHTLESLGKRFGLSPNYICALFSKHCDTTLTHYITALRMEAAKQAIETSALPLKVIAMQCGYNDYRYFNRVFKEYFGVSPGKFKE